MLKKTRGHVTKITSGEPIDCFRERLLRDFIGKGSGERCEGASFRTRLGPWRAGDLRGTPWSLSFSLALLLFLFLLCAFCVSSSSFFAASLLLASWGYTMNRSLSHSRYSLEPYFKNSFYTFSVSLSIRFCFFVFCFAGCEEDATSRGETRDQDKSRVRVRAFPLGRKQDRSMMTRVVNEDTSAVNWTMIKE
jgi:hypothetical protein